jgi:rubrerythrin
LALLNASDIVDLAMQLELNGGAFYRAVAAKTQDHRVRALFEDLAVQEDRHYQVFSQLAENVQEQVLMTDDRWRQVQSAFFEGEEKALAAADSVTAEDEALRMAIAFEKDTLLFFFDLRDNVPESDRSFIQKVVDEEKVHIRRLAELL